MFTKWQERNIYLLLQDGMKLTKNSLVLSNYQNIAPKAINKDGI